MTGSKLSIKFPKIDFKTKEKEFWWKYIVFVMIFYIGIQVFLNKVELSSTVLFYGIVLSMIQLAYMMHRVIYTFLYNGIVHGHTTFLLYGSGHVLFIVSMVAFALALIGTASMCFASILFFLAFVLLIAGFYGYRQAKPLLIYPRIIAVAEKEADEYMDGYSQRPVTTEFPEYDWDVMRRFARFLLGHIFIWSFREEKRSFTFILPPSISFRLSLKIPPQSSIKIFRDGRAVVSITPEDYDFLKVPISYHLLCQKVAERMKKSYELFEQGDEAGALGVFRVEKNR